MTQWCPAMFRGKCVCSDASSRRTIIRPPSSATAPPPVSIKLGERAVPCEVSREPALASLNTPPTTSNNYK